MASLAMGRAALNALSVAGSITEQACLGGCTRRPSPSLAVQSSVAGGAPGSTTSTLRAKPKSLRPTVAAALPTAEVTVTALGAAVSSARTALARSCASATGSSVLA